MELSARTHFTQRLVTLMRKLFFFLLLLVSLTLCTAAQADVFTFNDFSATCEIPSGKYTVITQETLDANAEFLALQGLTVDAAQADWEARGVVLQAWTGSGDVCIELSAAQDQFAQAYYDVNQVSEAERKTYRLGHSSDKDGYYRAQGYDYTSAVWKNTAKTGRFLQLEYTRTVNGKTYRGYARKTVRNGYSIHLDYQVHGRSVKTADKNALEDIMDTWAFLEVFPRPATSVSSLVFSSKPPQETSTGKFTLEGTGAPGLQIIGVVMRMSVAEPTQFTTTIGKNGKFDLDVRLPAEGYWMMTYTVVNGDTVVEEGAFEPITYQKTLLAVSLNGKLPTVLTGNELVISGITMPKTKVQCIVDGRYQKQITANSAGEFSFTIDTSGEGAYIITLTFQKKGYATRRFRSEASRTYTEDDLRQKVRDEAVKPSYSNLTKKIEGYTGRYMVYTLEIERVEKTSTGYLTFAGMSKNKSGVYKDRVVIRSSEEPPYTDGAKVRLYLKCLGTYDVVSDEGTNSYPYFDLEFMDP